MKKIAVLLCDDHTIIRQGLRLILEAEPDIEVVGEAEDGHQSVQETKRLRPDVVLLDLAMPRLNGVEAARRIKRDVPSTKVLILSSYSNDRYVRQAIEAGAVGYVIKEAVGNDLSRGIREVHMGKAFFSPLVAKSLLGRWREADCQACPTSVARLTSRQTEILQLIAEGYGNKQMAVLLSLAIKTVENHRQRLMDKLDIHKTAGLARYAVSIGAVESNCPPN